jgi:hypothetical protein
MRLYRRTLLPDHRKDDGQAPGFSFAPVPSCFRKTGRQTVKSFSRTRSRPRVKASKGCP